MLNDVGWSFEQTFFPYSKGEGTANVKCFGARLTLKFELRKKLKEGGDDGR